jgi:type IV secretory pathway TraG/TraD family ATPase VirD4
MTKDVTFTYDSSAVIDDIKGSTVDACCSACSAHGKCAVFLLSPTDECILLSADGVQKAAPGWTAGSPNGF